MSKQPAAKHPGSNRIARRPFVAELMARRRGALIVPGLGSATWDIFAAGDSADYLYSWGGMGLAVPTALGLAMARPERRVLALTGDGEMMMGIGSLAVVAAQAPANLAILVLDNEHFGETGRQRGLTGAHTDLPSVLKALHVQQRFALFAADVQGDDAATLHARFGSLLVELRPDDIAAPTQPAGVIRSDGTPLVVHQVIAQKSATQ